MNINQVALLKGNAFSQRGTRSQLLHINHLMHDINTHKNSTCLILDMSRLNSYDTLTLLKLFKMAVDHLMLTMDIINELTCPFGASSSYAQCQFAIVLFVVGCCWGGTLAPPTYCRDLKEENRERWRYFFYYYKPHETWKAGNHTNANIATELLLEKALLPMNNTEEWL